MSLCRSFSRLNSQDFRLLRRSSRVSIQDISRFEVSFVKTDRNFLEDDRDKLADDVSFALGNLNTVF